MEENAKMKEFYIIDKDFMEESMKTLEAQMQKELIDLKGKKSAFTAAYLSLKMIYDKILKPTFKDNYDAALNRPTYFFKEDQSKEPYLKSLRLKEISKYNPEFGDDRECECGHPYHRHFDSYEEMEAVGCKYCECFTFKEKSPAT